MSWSSRPKALCLRPKALRLQSYAHCLNKLTENSKKHPVKTIHIDFIGGFNSETGALSVMLNGQRRLTPKARAHLIALAFCIRRILPGIPSG